MSLRVALVDPGRQVPRYARFLAEALAEASAEVDYLTAPALHYAVPVAEGLRQRQVFGRLLGPEGSPRADWFARMAGPRRLLRALSYPAELLGLDRSLARRPPSVLHWQWSLWPAADRWLLQRARRRGIATLLTVHNSLPHERRDQQAASWSALYRSVDRLIVHAEVSRDRLQTMLGPDHPPIDKIPMPADPPAARLDRAAARERLGLGRLDDSSRPLALFFGHIRAYKGLDLLLEAWPMLRERLPQAQLLIAGRVLGGARAQEAWSRRVERARVNGKGGIEWRPGIVPAEDAGTCFAAADVVVLPYRDLDMSAVLATARAHARPVVATAVGGLPEALADGGGVLVPPGDPAALASALLQVLGDAGQRSALAEEAGAAAAAWTWQDAARAHLDAYANARASHAG